MLFLIIMCFYISISFASDSDYVNSATRPLVCSLYKIIAPVVATKKYSDDLIHLPDGLQRKIIYSIKKHFNINKDAGEHQKNKRMLELYFGCPEHDQNAQNKINHFMQSYLNVHKDDMDNKKQACDFFKKYSSNYRFDITSQQKITESLGGVYMEKSGSNSSLAELQYDTLCRQGSYEPDLDITTLYDTKIRARNNSRTSFQAPRKVSFSDY